MHYFKTNFRISEATTNQAFRNKKARLQSFGLGFITRKYFRISGFQFSKRNTPGIQKSETMNQYFRNQKQYLFLQFRNQTTHFRISGIHILKESNLNNIFGTPEEGGVGRLKLLLGVNAINLKEARCPGTLLLAERKHQCPDRTICALARPQ